MNALRCIDGTFSHSPIGTFTGDDARTHTEHATGDDMHAHVFVHVLYMCVRVRRADTIKFYEFCVCVRVCVLVRGHAECAKNMATD